MSVYIDDIEITPEQCKALLREFSVVPEVESYIFRSKRWRRNNQGKWAHPTLPIPYEVNVKRPVNNAFVKKMEEMKIEVPANFHLRWAYQKQRRRDGEKGFIYYPNVETGGFADDVYQKNVFPGSYGKRRAVQQGLGGIMLSYAEDYDLILFNTLSPHCKSSPFASKAPRYELVITAVEKEVAYAKAMKGGNHRMALAIAIVNLQLPMYELSHLRSFLATFNDNYDYQKLLSSGEPQSIQAACYDFVIGEPNNFEVFIDAIDAIRAEIKGALKKDNQGGHIVNIEAYIQEIIDKELIVINRDMGAILWNVDYGNKFKSVKKGMAFSLIDPSASDSDIHAVLLAKFQESESNWAKWLNLALKVSAEGTPEKIRSLFATKMLQSRFDVDKPYLDFYNAATNEIIEPLFKQPFNVPEGFDFDQEAMITLLAEKLKTPGGKKAKKMVDFYFDKIELLEKAKE